MKSEFENHPNSIQKEQAELFSNLIELDEKKLNSDQLITNLLQIYKECWPYGKVVAASLNYQGVNFGDDINTQDGFLYKSTIEGSDSDELMIRLQVNASKSGSVTDQKVLDATARLIASKLDKIKARKLLKEEREFLDKAYKLARIGTWEYDMINDHLHWSDITKEIHGFDSDYKPDVQSTVLLFKEGFHRETFAKTVEDAIERFKPFDVELKIISGKGDERWIRATGEPEFDENGVCTRFYGISQNVTNRKQSAEDLQLSERRFRALVQDGSDMIAILDKRAVYRYVSPTSLRILGIPAEDVIGKSALEFIHNEDKERVFGTLVGLKHKERVHISAYRFADAAGNWRWIESTLTNLSDDPAVNGYVANSRDVTEQYLRQQKMEGSLREKETLLSEIHHRINNNLTVLTSLLQMQASHENNREVLDKLADSVTRVHAMANIHEQLYQSQNFTKLELSERIKLLVMNIQNTFQVETAMEIRFECDEIYLDVDKSLPLSLILNEVITNIFKYAFKGQKTGKINIKLTDNGSLVECRIIDNGVGLPDDFDVRQSNSLGLTLIKSLAQQLKADYQFNSDHKGTEFFLSFEK